jgi:hypothetical protein
VKTATVTNASICFGNGAAVHAGFMASRSVFWLCQAASRPMGGAHYSKQLDSREKPIPPGEDCA